MTKILGSRKRNDGKQQDPPVEPPESVNINQDDMNIADGGEFLDDALRMEDQPFEETPVKEDQQTKFETKKNNYYEMF